ncbi:hypothetical protein [Cellulomonas persica]|uniref:Uncharacterized protein n=1 Tax=Cellulomonas persica TaxID=76861 RepID=A0A510UTR5_9CELL|nr:hypothetical protein [Cellulomonas persica]GEK18083.1 hypothetical protein CPE01_18160 [Cellulomonas persica]
MAVDTQRALVRDLASTVLASQAPDELALLDLTSEEFFADPDAALTRDRRDESLGFGIELAMLTPLVLAVVTPVVQFLVDLATDTIKETITDSAKHELTPRVAAWLRRVTRRGDDPAAPAPALGASPDSAPSGAVVPDEVAPALTGEQARAVHDLAHRRALDLGLDETRAGLLADAVVGGLVVA